MAIVPSWLGMVWAISIVTCCYLTGDSQATNLIRNPSFEDSDLHVWKFQQRQELWDLTTIEPDQTGNVNQSIIITKSRAVHGHRSLMMTWEHVKHQQIRDFKPVLLAAQFVPLDRNDAKGFHMRYRHWYAGKSSCWKFVADIRSVSNNLN